MKTHCRPLRSPARTASLLTLAIAGLTNSAMSNAQSAPIPSSSPVAPNTTAAPTTTAAPNHSAAQDAPVELPVVTVVGEAPAPYQATSINIGPLGTKSVLDTPYTVNTITEALMKNQQFNNTREALQYLPSVQVSLQGEDVRPQTRGFQAGVVENSRMDGLTITTTTDYPIEQFERIDVLNGPTAALFGPSGPAGTFNYVLKRPTSEPLRDITLGYDSNASLYARADLGGMFGKDDRFGYRVNLVEQGGEEYTPGSHLQRSLASLAFDFHIDPRTVLEANASTYHYRNDGLPGSFALAKGVSFPSAPDPTREGYGQPYAGDDNLTNTFSLQLKHSFNDDWRISAGVLHQSSDRASTTVINTLTNNNGAYTTTGANTTFSLDKILSNSLAINGTVHLFGMQHDLVLANNGYEWDRYSRDQAGSITLGHASIADPTIFPEPVWPNFSNRFHSINTVEQSVTVGDTITINKQWQVVADASQSWIDVHNYNIKGANTSNYHASGVSPTVSLVFKPQPNQSAYFTYESSLQAGDIAPTGVVNQGQSLSPYRSTEYELGYKIDLDKLSLAASVFRIQRPYAFVGADNVFGVQGEQVNKGIDLSASGNIGRDISVFAGAEFLDAKLDSSSNAGADGKQILGLPRVAAHALVEYHVPVIEGLTLSSDVAYQGRRPGNYSNTSYVSSFTTLGLGVRYVQMVYGKRLTWRLNVDNVTNRDYWAYIGPSGQNGYTGTDSGTGVIGAPRTVRLSLEMAL